jgi:hypothetical protein
MRKGKGCEERRTGRGGKALMAKPHGGKGKEGRKHGGLKWRSAKVKNRCFPFSSDL